MCVFVCLCTQLEGNLAERERQLLEKELLVEQVTRLTKPLGEQAENYQQDSLSLAKRVQIHLGREQRLGLMHTHTHTTVCL